MPAQLAGVAVQRDYGARIEIVAFTSVAVVIGAGVAGSPIHQVELGIVGAGDPGRRAAGLPALARPGFVPRLARTGDSPETPHVLAGLCVVRVEESANAELPAR